MANPSAHARTQASFAAAIIDPERSVPLTVRESTRRRAASGLAIYRNNVSLSLINFITARFPVVRALAGDESFFERVRQFIVTHPPRSPVLLGYGDAFPAFIRSLGPDACFRYVADVAELEWMRMRAYHAADATPLSADAFAACSIERVPDIRMSFHPSASLIRSRFPIVSVWHANQSNAAHPTQAWGAESALIVRPDMDVDVWKLPPGGVEFMASLLRRQTIAEAAAKGMEATAKFDLSANLSVLIGACAVTALI